MSLTFAYSNKVKSELMPQHHVSLYLNLFHTFIRLFLPSSFTGTFTSAVYGAWRFQQRREAGQAKRGPKRKEDALVSGPAESRMSP
jgi:hypothetical protein